MRTPGYLLPLANNVLERSTLGKGLASPIKINQVNGEFQRLEEEKLVYNNIADLLDTETGERVMEEDIGVDVRKALFEDPALVVDIWPIRIRDAIVLYEPRVKDVVAEGFELDNGAEIRVSWSYRATGRQDSYKVPFNKG